MPHRPPETYEHVVHGFAPVWDARSRVLVLGTLPSVKSRETSFYYGHPRNRFWRLLALLFEEPEPQSVEEKTALLLRNGVALWDVVSECDIRRSADSTIRNAAPNDVRPILAGADIRPHGQGFLRRIARSAAPSPTTSARSSPALRSARSAPTAGRPRRSTTA